MSVDIGTFLTRKGAIPLIYALARENGRFVDEIKDEVEATDQTVTDRINEARENKLIKLKYDPSDHGNAKRYVLTGRGLEKSISYGKAWQMTNRAETTKQMMKSAASKSVM